MEERRPWSPFQNLEDRKARGYTMKVLSVILEFLVYFSLLCLLALPFPLIVCFPSEAAHFTRIAEKLIPWGVVLFLCAIFSDGVKTIISRLIGILDRVKSVSAGGSRIELHCQQLNEIHLTAEQAQQLKDQVQAMSRQSQEGLNWARHFFMKYVLTTIYASQFRLLEALDSSPLSADRVLTFYSEFLARAPRSPDYSFDKWVGYLTGNFLIQFDGPSGTYVITQAGKGFYHQATAAKYTSDSFSY